MFRSFAKYYNFRVWIAGLIISNLGVWMQRTAQDWIVLTELTEQSASAVGYTTALQFAPQLLLMGVTGTIADRFDRRAILAVTQTVMAVLAIILTVLALAGVLEMWMMYSLALGLGLANAFDIPARQAFVVQIVDRGDLTNAVSLNSAGFNLARLLGPGLAGLLVAAIGAGWVFALNAASFIAVLISLVAIRVKDLNPVDRITDTRGRFREGLRYLRKNPSSIAVMCAMFLFGALGLNYSITVAAMANIEFQEGAEVFGLLTSTTAVGSLAGTLIVARLRAIRLRHLIGAAGATAVAGGIAAVMPSSLTFGIALIPMGMSIMFMISSANAYVQLATAPEYLGRVLAIYSAMFIGAMPVGSPIVGGAVDLFGPRWGLALTVLAGVFAAAILLGWVGYDRRKRNGSAFGSRLS